MRRVNVIGTSGSGKTTFAVRLAEVMNVPHIELDALHWQPNWTEASSNTFRDAVKVAAAGEGWVIDGNYGLLRDIIWSRSDTLVWLDYSFRLTLWRAFRRTLRRVLGAESCCNGNRETLFRVLSRDSILVWVFQTHARRRREYRALLPAFVARGSKAVVLRTPGEAERWLAGR